jgi:hypothetical protein
MELTREAFGDYWQQTLDDLARYPAAPEIDPLPLRTTAFATLYGVRLTSLGPYRLFGSTTLLRVGAPGTLLDGLALRPLVTALRGQVAVHESEQSSYKDGLYAEQWTAAQCGITDVQSILPEHWRE